MKTHKIRIRTDIKYNDDFVTLDEYSMRIDPNEVYESITAQIDGESDITLIYIQDEWRQVSNIDFEDAR